MSNEQDKKKRNKNKFIATFAVVMLLFAAVRHLFSIEVPGYAVAKNNDMQLDSNEVYVGNGEDEIFDEEYYNPADSVIEEGITNATDQASTCSFGVNDPYGRPHRIRGVWSYDKCFHDLNDVQIIAAQKNGITPVKNREEAQELIKSHALVNISNSPFYVLDDLTHSMPYLVPKAQQLLNTICLNFIDSLQMKGIAPHLPMVTSVLRTTDDVKSLQKGNGNATTNSCHCYGTTVDISYNRFVPITGEYNPSIPLTRWNENMKQVLSEVLDDLRQKEKCYVKYEMKQGCYHLTVR